MNRSRLPIVLVLIASIAVAGLTRSWAWTERTSGKGAVMATGGAKLSQLNSFALTLLLGGLRGPLVMFLWPSAETQKQEKNLDDFDTKIELIRLLQAEFDTVHIFQIWNKAYNISVQMANLGNKYRTILSALDYAHQTDAERPNDINILAAIGQVYFDKLANSTEKVYYRQRVRDESMPRQDMIRVQFPTAQTATVSQVAIDNGMPSRRIGIELVQGNAGQSTVMLPKPVADAIKAKFGEADFKYSPRPTISAKVPGGRGELEPMLDADFNILPSYLAAKLTKPADWPADKEFLDGSELQFLKRFEPYPYGVSPWALGYNYWKRAQVLQSSYNQKHAQLSDLVIDSRPALALKFWAEEELERGRLAEIDAFEREAPTGENPSYESVTADVPLDAKPARPAGVKEALFEYGRGAELTVAALAEYNRHLKADPTNLSTYLSHIDELNAENELMQGDRDYLLALSDPSQRSTKIESAKQHYQEAARRYEVIILTYTITDDVAQKTFPKGLTRATIAKENLPLNQVEAIFAASRKALPANLAAFENGEDFQQYQTYIDRAHKRLSLLPQ